MNERGISAPAFLIAVFVYVGCMLAFVGCGKKESSSSSDTSVKADSGAFDPMALELSDPKLIEGRTIWMPTCGKCHLSGLGGAPVIGDVDAWKARIAKGKDTLYKNAIEGFTSPTYNTMPPKGGFTDLSDEQVKLAVDFVTHASK